jgi:hypothetical protein
MFKNSDILDAILDAIGIMFLGAIVAILSTFFHDQVVAVVLFFMLMKM